MPPTTTRTLNPVPFEHWEPKRFGRGAAALLRVPALVAACKATGPDPNSRVTSRHFGLDQGGDPGVHVEIEPPVGGSHAPRSAVSARAGLGRSVGRPVRASENPLEHLQRQKLDGVGRRTGHRLSVGMSRTARNNRFEQFPSPRATRTQAKADRHRHPFPTVMSSSAASDAQTTSNGGW